MKTIKTMIRISIFVIGCLILFSCKKNVVEVENATNESTDFKKVKDGNIVKEYLTIPEGEYKDRIGQKLIMSIKYEDQIYYFEITLANSETDISKWTFSGRYDVSIGGVYYKNSKNVILEYEDDNLKNPIETEVYALGTGIMKLENNLLYWKDDQEGTLEKRDYCAVFEKIVEGHTNTMLNITNNYYGNYQIPNYNQYQVPADVYGYSQNGVFLIPYNSYYYITGYDRDVYSYSSGQPMASRVPILAGNYSYPTAVANNLLYNAYMSIRKWCNEYVAENNNVQDYYLNFANIESETPTQIVMIVNCALQKKGIIDGHIDFRVTLNIQGNRYIWRKLGNNRSSFYKDVEVYEFDSANGQIIIIR